MSSFVLVVLVDIYIFTGGHPAPPMTIIKYGDCKCCKFNTYNVLSGFTYSGPVQSCFQLLRAIGNAKWEAALKGVRFPRAKGVWSGARELSESQLSEFPPLRRSQAGEEGKAICVLNKLAQPSGSDSIPTYLGHPLSCRVMFFLCF